MPAHRKDNCGTCDRPLSGENLYLSPTGRRGCNYCRIKAALAAKARKRERRITALEASSNDTDRFKALVTRIRDELGGLAEEDRAAYYATPRTVTQAEQNAGDFTRRRVDLEQAGELTGLTADSAQSTLSGHLRAARKAHAAGSAGPKTMPLPSPGGTWAVWQLAMWRAAVWPSHHLGNTGQWKNATDDQLIPVLTDVINAQGRGATISGFREAIAEAGLAETANATFPRLQRIVAKHGLKAARPATPGGDAPVPGESLRWDGRLSTSELAALYQCTPDAVRIAVKRGELTPLREGIRMFFHPDAVTARRNGQITPVDKGHKLAIPQTVAAPPPS